MDKPSNMVKLCVSLSNWAYPSKCDSKTNVSVETPKANIHHEMPSSPSVNFWAAKTNSWSAKALMSKSSISIVAFDVQFNTSWFIQG